jgi:septation ring formation regulator EzrA
MDQPEVDYETMTHSELRAYLERLEMSVTQVQKRLIGFEDRFGTTTEEMFASITPEEIEARPGLSEWAGELEMLQRLEAQRTALADRLKS